MPSEKTAALLKQVPGPDNQSLNTPEKVDQFAKTVDAFLAGGKEGLADLVTALKSPSEPDEEDAKARFVLHTIAVRVAGNESQRRVFAEALAASLEKDLPDRAPHFVVQQLQVCGGREAAPALGKLLLNEDSDLANTAAQALVAIGSGAAEQLRAALPKAKGANRLVVIQNLGVLADKESASAIRQALADEDLETRLAAGRALAHIGDAASADALLAAVKKEKGLARAQAADACLVLAEKLEAADNKSAAEKIRAGLK